MSAFTNKPSSGTGDSFPFCQGNPSAIFQQESSQRIIQDASLAPKFGDPVLSSSSNSSRNTSILGSGAPASFSVLGLAGPAGPVPLSPPPSYTNTHKWQVHPDDSTIQESPSTATLPSHATSASAFGSILGETPRQPLSRNMSVPHSSQHGVPQRSAAAISAVLPSTTMAPRRSQFSPAAFEGIGSLSTSGALSTGQGKDGAVSAFTSLREIQPSSPSCKERAHRVPNNETSNSTLTPSFGSGEGSRFLAGPVPPPSIIPTTTTTSVFAMPSTSSTSPQTFKSASPSAGGHSSSVDASEAPALGRPPDRPHFFSTQACAHGTSAFTAATSSSASRSVFGSSSGGILSALPSASPFTGKVTTTDENPSQHVGSVFAMLPQVHTKSGAVSTAMSISKGCAFVRDTRKRRSDIEGADSPERPGGRLEDNKSSSEAFSMRSRNDEQSMGGSESQLPTRKPRFQASGVADAHLPQASQRQTYGPSQPGQSPRNAQPPSFLNESVAHSGAVSRGMVRLPLPGDSALPLTCRVFLSLVKSLAADDRCTREAAWTDIERAFFGVVGKVGMTGTFESTLRMMLLLWERERDQVASLQHMRGEVWVATFALGCHLNLMLYALETTSGSTQPKTSDTTIEAFKESVRADPVEALADACLYANQLNELVLKLYQCADEMRTPLSLLPLFLRRVRNVFDVAAEYGVTRVQSNMKTVSSKLFSVLSKRVKSQVVKLPSPQNSREWKLTASDEYERQLILSFAHLISEMLLSEAPGNIESECFIRAFHRDFPDAREERCTLYYRQANRLIQQPLNTSVVQVAADLLARAVVTCPAGHDINMRMLFIKLTATLLALGKVPQMEDVQQYQVSQLTDVILAVRSSNLALLDLALRNNAVWYIEVGITNVLQVVRERIALLMVVKFYASRGGQSQLSVADMVNHFSLPYSELEAETIWLLPLLVERRINGVLDHHTLVLSNTTPFDDYDKNDLLKLAQREYSETL